MRRGFSVRANACRCQAFFPKKLRRSTICKRRLATLLILATSEENYRTSPARKGVSGSLGAGCSIRSAGFEVAGGSETAVFSSTAGIAETAAGCDFLETRAEGPSPYAQYKAPAAQASAARIAVVAEDLLMLFL